MSNTRKCPNCQNEVFQEALFCPFCGAGMNKDVQAFAPMGAPRNIERDVIGPTEFLAPGKSVQPLTYQVVQPQQVNQTVNQPMAPAVNPPMNQPMAPGMYHNVIRVGYNQGPQMEKKSFKEINRRNAGIPLLLIIMGILFILLAVGISLTASNAVGGILAANIAGFNGLNGVALGACLIVFVMRIVKLSKKKSNI